MVLIVQNADDAVKRIQRLISSSAPFFIVLTGPSGCGKSFCLKQIASQLDVPIIPAAKYLTKEGFISEVEKAEIPIIDSFEFHIKTTTIDLANIASRQNKLIIAAARTSMSILEHSGYIEMALPPPPSKLAHSLGKQQYGTSRRAIDRTLDRSLELQLVGAPEPSRLTPDVSHLDTSSLTVLLAAHLARVVPVSRDIDLFTSLRRKGRSRRLKPRSTASSTSSFTGGRLGRLVRALCVMGYGPKGDSLVGVERTAEKLASLGLLIKGGGRGFDKCRMHAVIDSDTASVVAGHLGFPWKDFWV